MSHIDHTVRLPAGVAREIERLAQAAGVTSAQFLASAAAEKLDAVRSARALLEERGAGGDPNANWEAFDRVFGQGGEPPRPGDEAA